MNVETAVIAYVFICIALTISCAILVPARHFANLRLKFNTSADTIAFFRAMSALDNNSNLTLSPKRVKSLAKRLKKSSRLTAFVVALQRTNDQSFHSVNNYTSVFMPVFVDLVKVYEKQPVLYKTYYIYALGEIFKGVTEVDEKIIVFLIASLRENSLYCRQNAMTAFYKFGNVDNTIRAIRVLNRIYDDYNSKIIMEGLIGFNGDKRLLADKLLENYADMKDYMKLAILNFVRFTQSGHDEHMFRVLADKTADEELHYAAIRYFGKYRNEKARSMLFDFLINLDDEHPEYAAVSASSLANYPGEETIETLKNALGSRDWYVRLNSSVSLERLGVDYQSMSDILTGSDRYAREIVLYRLQLQRSLEEQRQDTTVA